MKVIYRLKSIELIKENILWQILEVCRNHEVVNRLNKYLIQFYMYFSPAIPFNLRKSRIDDLLNKIK